MSYDRAITVFSPDGRLFQVEYATEAVRRGGVAIGVVSSDTIVFGVEKKNVGHLQDARTIRKIYKLDDHLTLTFAGLTADSRALVDRARIECQSHRLTFEEPATVEHIARFIAETQQKFTQRGGRRPFGLSTLIAGFDPNGTPRLFQTDPTGTYTEWKACAVGRSATPIMGLLERLYFNEEPVKEGDRDSGQSKSKVASTEELAIAQAAADPVRIALQALSEVVDGGAKGVEVVTIKNKQPFSFVPAEEVDVIFKAIKEEKEELTRQGRAPEPIVLDSEAY
jgi:20S proteasome subunit alpha 4